MLRPNEEPWWLTSRFLMVAWAVVVTAGAITWWMLR